MLVSRKCSCWCSGSTRITQLNSFRKFLYNRCNWFFNEVSRTEPPSLPPCRPKPQPGTHPPKSFQNKKPVLTPVRWWRTTPNLKARNAISVLWPPFPLYARAVFLVVRPFFWRMPTEQALYYKNLGLYYGDGVWHSTSVVQAPALGLRVVAYLVTPCLLQTPFPQPQTGKHKRKKKKHPQRRPR